MVASGTQPGALNGPANQMAKVKAISLKQRTILPTADPGRAMKAVARGPVTAGTSALVILTEKGVTRSEQNCASKSAKVASRNKMYDVETLRGIFAKLWSNLLGH